MGLISKSLVLVVALTTGFLILGTIVMPFFGTTYEHSQGVEPCPKSGCTATDTGNTLINQNCLTNSGSFSACANCNTTAGYSTFLKTCHSLIAYNNNTHCNGCSAFNNYNSTYQALLVIIFVIGLIGLGLTFLPRFN